MTMLNDGLQTRYVELRFEGENVVSGTMMRYGDTARLPWGEDERFERGAFGDVSQLDFRLNVQHERQAIVARTGGGGLTAH